VCFFEFFVRLKSKWLQPFRTGVEGEEIALHGPDESEGEKSSQNDVDSLLAELGF